jgi:hypothetical protein
MDVQKDESLSLSIKNYEMRIGSSFAQLSCLSMNLKKGGVE